MTSLTGGSIRQYGYRIKTEWNSVSKYQSLANLNGVGAQALNSVLYGAEKLGCLFSPEGRRIDALRREILTSRFESYQAQRYFLDPANWPKKIIPLPCSMERVLADKNTDIYITTTNEEGRTVRNKLERTVEEHVAPIGDLSALDYTERFVGTIVRYTAELHGKPLEIKIRNGQELVPAEELTRLPGGVVPIEPGSEGVYEVKVTFGGVSRWISLSDFSSEYSQIIPPRYFEELKLGNAVLSLSSSLPNERTETTFQMQLPIRGKHRPRLGADPKANKYQVVLSYNGEIRSINAEELASRGSVNNVFSDQSGNYYEVIIHSAPGAFKYRGRDLENYWPTVNITKNGRAIDRLGNTSATSLSSAQRILIDDEIIGIYLTSNQ